MNLPLSHRQQAVFAVNAALSAQNDFTDLEGLSQSIVDSLEKNGFILTLAGAPRRLTWAEKKELEERMIGGRRKR